MLPLHVFEERYRLLVREGRDFGVVLIRQGREVGPGLGDDVHLVGTMATLDRVDALPDGRYHVIARGLERFRVRRLEHGRPYLTAEVEQLEEPSGSAGRRLLELLARYSTAHGVEPPEALAAHRGQRMVWLAGSILQAEPGKRQQLLETGSAELAEAMLADELARLESLGRLATLPRRRLSPN